MSDVPKSIHRYEIVERLGQGGMGELFLASDPLLDRFVAIKVLRAGLDSDELRERFAREARSAARLAHINIVTIYDVGEHEGQPYIAMEYVLGETLFHKIRWQRELPLDTKLQYVDELCAGLAHAHKAGIIHRDIKPANLMIVSDGGTLKILDFGIARLADSSMTQSGMVLGTLNYMSPEQITGQLVDHRSDMFSVGAVFYELLSYQLAFPGGIDSGVFTRITSGAPTPLTELCPDIDPSIVRIVERAIRKAPADRFADLVEMRAELANARERLDRRVLESPLTTTIRRHPPPVGHTPPGQQVRTPRRGTNREEIRRRRAEELASQLAAARRAFEAGRLEEASAACERVLILEPDHEEALDLSERARAAIERHQIRDWAIEARAELERGNLQAAKQLLSSIMSLDDNSDEARSLRAAIAHVESRRLADEAVAGGRASLESGDAGAAAAAARDALRAHPTHTGAAALLRDAGLLAEEQRRKAEHDRRAAEVIENARVCFAAGAMDEAIALLKEFSPAHPDVDDELAELGEEARKIRAAEFAREQQASAEIVIARAWISRDDLDEAAAAVARAREIFPRHSAIAEVEREILKRGEEIAARRRAEEEARRKAEEERLRAEEEARRKAEEEARRKEEDERRRTEEEARRKAAEEARRRAEETARKKAAEEARRKAAEEARKKAADDARKKAEEETRRRAEAEARAKAEAEARKAEEDARKAEEDARRKSEEAARQKAAEKARRKADEEEAEQRAADRRRQLEEETRKRAEEDARRDAADEARKQAEAAARGKAAAASPLPASAMQTVVNRPVRIGDTAEPLQQPSPVPLVSPAAAAPRAGAGRRQVVPLAAAAAVVLGAVIGFAIWRSSTNEESPGVRLQVPEAPAESPAQPPSPPASSTAAKPSAPETPPASTSPATSSAIEPQLVPLRRQARQQIQSDQRAQALETVEKGLRLSPTDSELLQVVASLLRDARAATVRSKENAVKAGAPKSAEQRFSDGLRREAEATGRDQAANQVGNVRSLWAATESFDKAASQAHEAAEKAAADEATRQREAAEKRLAADQARAKEIAEAQARQVEVERKLKEQTKVTETPAPVVPSKGATSQPAAPAGPSDEEGVRETLRRYEAAYESLDVSAVAKVYPSVRADQLAAAFRQYRSYDLEILVQDMQFAPTRTSATVSARVTYGFQPLSGRRVSNTVVQRFMLQKEGGTWRIDGIR